MNEREDGTAQPRRHGRLWLGLAFAGGMCATLMYSCYYTIDVKLDSSQAVGAGTLGTSSGGPGNNCQVQGQIKYNNSPVANETIECHTSGGGSQTDMTDGNGNYQCLTPMPTGNVWFVARGKSSDYCADASGNVKNCTSLTACNANVSGCGQPTVQWSLLVPPGFWLRRRWRKRAASSREVSRA